MSQPELPPTESVSFPLSEEALIAEQSLADRTATLRSGPRATRICGTLRLDRAEVEAGQSVRVFWDIPGAPHNRCHWIGMFDAGASGFSN